MRIGISPSTVLVLASITVMVSSFALETKTRSPAARIPRRTAAAVHFRRRTAGRCGRRSPLGRRGRRDIDHRHRIRLAHVGIAQARDRHAAAAGGALAPLTASALGKPKAGKANPGVALLLRRSAPGNRLIFEHPDVRDVQLPAVRRKRDRERQAAHLDGRDHLARPGIDHRDAEVRLIHHVKGTIALGS